MTPNNLGANSAISKRIVPQESQLLHIMQMLKKLNPIPIAGFKDLGLKLQVQNLVHFERLFRFSTKSKDKNYLIVI